MPRTFYIDGSNVNRLDLPRGKSDLRRAISIAAALEKTGAEVRCFVDPTERHWVATHQKELLDNCVRNLNPLFVQSPNSADDLILCCVSDKPGIQVVSNDHYREFERHYEWARLAAEERRTHRSGMRRLIKVAVVAEDLFLHGIWEDGKPWRVRILSDEQTAEQIEAWVLKRSLRNAEESAARAARAAKTAARAPSRVSSAPSLPVHHPAIQPLRPQALSAAAMHTGIRFPRRETSENPPANGDDVWRSTRCRTADFQGSNLLGRDRRFRSEPAPRPFWRTILERLTWRATTTARA